jgi:histidine triad (HIT) family protein
MDDCLFCKIAKKEIPAELVLETDTCVAFKDINPVAPHHYLVIPKKHFISLAEIDEESSVQVLSAIQSLTLKLGLKDFRTIFNTGAKSGQSVFHLHAHVIAGRELEWPPG